MFSTRYTPEALADWCRVLRHQLGAGLPPVKIFKQMASSGPASLRSLSARLETTAKEGHSISAGLKPEADALPTIFIPLVQVGEETGRLTEILGELENYLRQEHQMRRQIAQQTFLPKIQLFLAIIIVAGLIWILGMIATTRGGTPMSVFGLSGGTGAMIFLLATLGPVLVIWVWARALAGSSKRLAALQNLLFKLPVVGPCLDAMMLGRFSLALGMTLNSSLSLAKALRLSFAAAGHSGLQASADEAVAAVKNGKSLHLALARCPLLSGEFLDMIAMSEEAGSMPEMMKHQAQQYQELARDRLTNLTRLAGLGIWMLVAIFIVINIFRIASIYLSALGV